jgi:hypothetical protein
VMRTDDLLAPENLRRMQFRYRKRAGSTGK